LKTKWEHYKRKESWLPLAVHSNAEPKFNNYSPNMCQSGQGTRGIGTFIRGQGPGDWSKVHSSKAGLLSLWLSTTLHTNEGQSQAGLLSNIQATRLGPGPRTSTFLSFWLGKPINLIFPWLRIQFEKKSRSAEAAKRTRRNDRKAQAAKAWEMWLKWRQH
jgi:hypothetical protein